MMPAQFGWRPWSDAAVTAAMTAMVLGIATLIEFTGGLPSQLAHLYYIPVVASALLAPRRLSLGVALLASVAVSPLMDVAHRAWGLGAYYADPSPWNVTSSGWIVRPLAFVVINLLAGETVKQHAARLAESRQSAARGDELSILSHIDRMILNGASEHASIIQIARLVALLTGAQVAAVVLPDREGKRIQVFNGYVLDASESSDIVSEIPLGEGVSGTALQSGRSSTSRNVFCDSRYQRLADVARRAGYVSAAAAPITLDQEVIGALVVGYGEERDFTEDELVRLERLAGQAAIAIGHARQREGLEELARETALALASAIESRDAHTGHHCIRLAEYAGAVAQRLGLSDKEVQSIRLGAALHDIGKISVPDSILLKPGALTDDEYDVMKQHGRIGAEICRRISLGSGLDEIVAHHHEHYDGSGYPDGLAGEEIPLGARIVAVVDAFDAMTTDRPYRPAMSSEEAVAILHAGAGAQWDAGIIECFLATLDARDDRLAA